MTAAPDFDRQFVDFVVSMVMATIERHRPRDLTEIDAVLQWLDRALAAAEPAPSNTEGR